jgi:hypothetical protein
MTKLTTEQMTEQGIEILAELICSLAVAFGYELRYSAHAQEIFDRVQEVLTRAVEKFDHMEEWRKRREEGL